MREHPKQDSSTIYLLHRSIEEEGTRQAEENRNILHLLFAHTTNRGRNTEVIEDTVPLYNVKCGVRCAAKPSAIKLAPSGEAIDFDYADGVATFIVPKVDIHQMVEIS